MENEITPSRRPIRPMALLLSSLAYFYNSVQNGDIGAVGVGRIGPLNPLSPLTINRGTNLVVDTNYGLLRGTRHVSRSGRSFYSFRGVPYAEAPINELRYEPPEPPLKWQGIRDATRYGSQCLQMNVITRSTAIGTENCLFLNVFTHKILKRRDVKYSASLNPVIVYIHGGLFMSGNGNIYRPKYFMDEDVVMVTLNYRLTSFGFLNTGDDVVRGNMGLKDQVMALKWVKDNIKFFGGNSSSVTIMGESAGAAASHLHTLSPLSKDLIHRAISMSGTAISPWAFVEKPKEQSIEYAEDLGCPTSSTIKMVKCLKSLDAIKIARTHFRYINALAQNKQSVFGPTVEAVVDENTFLPANPLELMKSGRINPVPMIMGINADEGLVYLIPIIRNATMQRLVNNIWKGKGRSFTNFLNLQESELRQVTPQLLDDIHSFYLNGSNVGLQTLKESATILSDRAFFLDNHDAAVMHSRVAPVYAYFYEYSGRYAMAKLLFVKSPLPFAVPDRYDFALGTVTSWLTDNVLGIREPNYFGIGHSDEIPLFFNTPVVRREVSADDEDYDFSRRIVSLWSSFAETGVPNSNAVGGDTWISIPPDQDGNQTLQRMHLNYDFKMADEPFFDRLQFWKSRNISYL